jgi:hypothetical protein
LCFRVGPGRVGLGRSSFCAVPGVPCVYNIILYIYNISYI